MDVNANAEHIENVNSIKYAVNPRNKLAIDAPN